MTALTNADLRFKVTIHRNTKKFDFTDILGTIADWDFYLTPVSLSFANVKGLVKGVSSSGTVFYGGTAYNADDFATPDTDGSSGVSGDWTNSTLAMPATLTSGLYTFYYKTQIQVGLGSGVGLPAFGKAAGVFSVTTTDYTPFMGTGAVVGLKLQVVSSTPGRSGVFDITNISFSTDTLITVTGAGAGSYSAGATDKLYIIYQASKSLYYGYSTITGSLECESDCRNSLMEASDSTVYSVLKADNNTTYNPTTTTRAWTIVYPSSVLANISATTNPVIFGAGTSYNSGANIYTGDYAVSLATTLSYNIEEWDTRAAGDYFWYLLADVETFSTTHTVNCSECLCSLYTCLVALDARITANVGNVRVWQELMSLRNNLSWYLLMFLEAERCGESTDVWCEKIVAAINSADCTCENDTTTVTEVIPISTIIGGGSSTQATIYTRTVIECYPTSPVANDIVIFTTSGTLIDGTVVVAGALFQYISGAWVYQLNIVGTSGSSAVGVLINDIGDDSTVSSGSQTLKTGTTGTVITTDGSYIDIDALYQVNAGITAVLTVEYATDLPNLIDVPVVATSTTYYRLFCRVHRASSTTTFVESYYEILGTPNSKIELPPFATGDDMAADNTINMKKNISVGTETDVIAKKLTITSFNL